MDLVDIAPAFSFLVDKGLVLTQATHHTDSFGDSLVEMRGDTFSLRFIRDRGQVFVETGSKEKGWYALESILKLVNDSITSEQIKQPPNVENLAKLLYENWGAVESLFLDQQIVMKYPG